MMKNLKKEKQKWAQANQLTSEQKGQKLLEFTEIYKRAPRTEEKEYTEFHIGNFWYTVRKGHHKKLYENELKHNSYLFEDYNRYHENKKLNDAKLKLSGKQKADKLLEFISKPPHKIPTCTTKYDGINIGEYWTGIKGGSFPDIYDKLLKHNDKLREDYEKTQKNRNDKEKNGIITTKNRVKNY